MADGPNISDRRMATKLLACAILEPVTGKPWFLAFFDARLEKDPTLIPQLLKSGQAVAVHESGKGAVFTAVVAEETAEIKKYLSAFRRRVEGAFPNGMKEGHFGLSDQLMLRGIVQEVFIMSLI